MWKYFVQATNNMRIRNKLIFSYLFVVMIPVLIVGGIITAYFRQDALDNAIEQTANDVDKIKSQLSTMLSVPISISNKLYLDDNLKDLVNTNYTTILQMVQAYSKYNDFEELPRLYNEISNVRFYHYNRTMINNTQFINVTAKIEGEEWFQTAMNNPRIGWFFMEGSDIGTEKKLSLVRRIKFKDYRTPGVLVITLNQSMLNSILSKETFNTLIADDSGYIVAAKNPQNVGKTLKQLDLNIDMHQGQEQTISRRVNGVSSNIIVDKLTPQTSLNGLSVVSVFSTQGIVQDAKKVGWIGMALVIGVLILALTLIFVVSKLTTNRLLHLSRQLNKVARGNFDTISFLDGNDEIGQLSRQFNYMVRSINDLLNQVYESNEKNTKLEVAQKEIKLKMMASQINPHFLFNALESIRMKAHLNGEKEIANIVRLLGKLMRKNLEVGSVKKTLKEEMDIVRAYLEIQKFRYEDRLNYELIVEPETERVLLPPLIIQPLVENAIIHGLEGKELDGMLRVRCSMKEDMLHVEVIDNGAGMSEERRQFVLATLDAEEEEGNRIGLRNIHQRIKLTYGDDFGLHITSIPGQGTKMEFMIPTGGEMHV
ncbi:sensor histidine kinase [Paenibacillus favisporus]|uniref:sensor histidine kinase n=1 Tax=Paenibacillus favisporus TaxID=221028 RepID=UPI003D2CE4B7